MTEKTGPKTFVAGERLADFHGKRETQFVESLRRMKPGIVDVMLNDAADMVATRQVSKKKPRTYGDYREMLKEKDLDVVLIATPDHWHALPTIEAVKSGADIYVQKPTGVDVMESAAMVAAAR